MNSSHTFYGVVAHYKILYIGSKLPRIYIHTYIKIIYNSFNTCVHTKSNCIYKSVKMRKIKKILTEAKQRCGERDQKILGPIYLCRPLPLSMSKVLRACIRYWTPGSCTIWSHAFCSPTTLHA